MGNIDLLEVNFSLEEICGSLSSDSRKKVIGYKNIEELKMSEKAIELYKR